MNKVVAAITMSVDGYFTGPDDGPGCGLGVDGERLHYWVFGGPWSYESGPRGETTGEDQAWLDEAMERVGAVVGGRWTYEAADHWGGTNPWGIPFFIVTHRPEEQPDASAGFQFVDGLEPECRPERLGSPEHYPDGYGERQERSTHLADRAPCHRSSSRALF